jgi:hypothetical protein
MSRLAIAFVLALAAATATANAQDTRSGQPQTPAGAHGNGLRPFLFDARMPGDGSRRRAVADENHRTAGAIVVPPKESEPARDR